MIEKMTQFMSKLGMLEKTVIIPVTISLGVEDKEYNLFLAKIPHNPFLIKGFVENYVNPRDNLIEIRHGEYKELYKEMGVKSAHVIENIVIDHDDEDSCIVDSFTLYVLNDCDIPDDVLGLYFKEEKNCLEFKRKYIQQFNEIYENINKINLLHGSNLKPINEDEEYFIGSHGKTFYINGDLKRLSQGASGPVLFCLLLDEKIKSQLTWHQLNHFLDKEIEYFSKSKNKNSRKYTGSILDRYFGDVDVKFDHILEFLVLYRDAIYVNEKQHLERFKNYECPDGSTHYLLYLYKNGRNHYIILKNYRDYWMLAYKLRKSLKEVTVFTKIINNYDEVKTFINKDIEIKELRYSTSHGEVELKDMSLSDLITFNENIFGENDFKDINSVPDFKIKFNLVEKDHKTGSVNYTTKFKKFKLPMIFIGDKWTVDTQSFIGGIFYNK